ncbi:MAG: aldo/keto reductase [Desulfovibrionaceae bacterium]|nr:aldo/keto reductase [Desulfovibrionaceae bacterium]
MIRRFGISSYEPKQALDWMREPEVDIVQVPVNVLDKRWIEADLAGEARQNAVTVFARSIYLQGLLLLDGPGLERANMDWAAGFLRPAKDFAAGRGLDFKAFCIRVVAQTFPEAILVMGVQDQAQLEENLRLFQDRPLPAELVELWWRNLPGMPTRLLNPSLWER